MAKDRELKKALLTALGPQSTVIQPARQGFNSFHKQRLSGENNIEVP
jgi:hypothetical protein